MGENAKMYEWSSQALVEQYSSMVFRVALTACGSRAEAEDLMQEVFLRLVQTRPDFSSAEHAKAWLLRVTMNCCASLGRSVWKRRVGSLDEWRDYRDATTDSKKGSANADEPAAALDASQQRTDVLSAVAKLPPKQRLCVHLFYFEEQSIAEISTLTSWPTSTVKSHLRRGRSNLRATLSEEYDYDN